MRSLLAQLQLVYPPISNQEAGWLADNEEFRAYVKRSKLYMLAQRQEVLFGDYSVNHETLEFSFNLNMGQENQTSLTFDIKQVVGDQFDTINIEVGPKLLRVWDVIEDNVKGGKELLYWATTDKLLYDIWRGYVEVSGEVNVRSFTRYSLYYVGISKSQDSISRLFDNGHRNRTRILDNETQITPIARLTDEIYIFLFDINELGIKEMTSAKPSDSDIYDFLDSTLTPKVNLVADAEKGGFCTTPQKGIVHYKTVKTHFSLSAFYERRE